MSTGQITVMRCSWESRSRMAYSIRG